MDFLKFKNAVAKKFENLSKSQLYCTAVEKDDMWNTYLESFPAGTNPMFRKKTEYDCSCCRQFIKAVGNVVAIDHGKLVSIWDVDAGDPSFQVVADQMAQFVKTAAIRDQFLHYEKHAGTDKNIETGPDHMLTWNHFYVQIPYARNSGHNYFCPGADIATRLSEKRAIFDSFSRGLNEITVESLQSVLELIAQNSIYRGTEHKYAVSEFLKMKNAFNSTPESERSNFVWDKLDQVPVSVAKIRGTAIGTLLTDLSADVDLEDAVRLFESKVAPQNYKRTTSLVTKAMVANARKLIDDLGLNSALERRFAHLTDVNVNNILFANRDARKSLKGDVFDLIETKASTKKFDKVEEIGIDKFIAEIVPRASSIELMFENKHAANLVSLVAPVDSHALDLFKWNNKFSWAYNGDVTDSIKERVKKAGGNVSGELCCRLAWHNHDDLDFHMREPNGGHIYYGTRGTRSFCGGKLDVDMNAGRGDTREPVENIFYEKQSGMKEGTYELSVHQYAKRESKDVGFEVEIDILGEIYNFAYDKAVRDSETIQVAKFTYSKAKGIEIIPNPNLVGKNSSKTFWAIRTGEFHKVNLMMYSPNYWDGHGVGNKHHFFFLEGCKNDETVRGFYNEFLRDDLNKHRKVLEMVGAKIKTDDSSEQLSGLGFSSTQKNSVLARIEGSFTRTVKIVF